MTDKWTVATFSAWRWLDGSDSPHVVAHQGQGQDLGGHLRQPARRPGQRRHLAPDRRRRRCSSGPTSACSPPPTSAQTWEKIGANLPLVSVQEINIQVESETLFAATYGRSIWETSLE